jgi:DNA-binding MarR family transcriptional regulator
MKHSTHVLPQDREICACTTLRELARRATAIYDDVLGPLGLKQTQYAVLARLDGLVQCSLGELADVCNLDVTSMSRGLRPLITNGWVKAGRGKDDRTKRYELTAQGKQVARKAFALWKKAQSRLHEVIPQEHIRTLKSLSGILKELDLGERQ